MFTSENEIICSSWRQIYRLLDFKRIRWLSETDLVSQSNLKKKLSTGQCTLLEVAYQESNVKISKDKFRDHEKIFYDWGEEFVISFDFEAFEFPPSVTNILHIYDYGLWDYGDEPLEGYGRVIPGCWTFHPWNFSTQCFKPDFFKTRLFKHEFLNHDRFNQEIKRWMKST